VRDHGPRRRLRRRSEPFVDAETGFQYLRARYYEPATGQFLSRDPMVAMTGSPYGYVDGDPLNGTDPLGLFSLRKHWRGIAQGLTVVALVVAVVAVPVAVAGFMVVADAGLVAALPVLSAATGLGVASSLLGTASTGVVCRYGTEQACHWSTTTTAAGWGTGALGHFMPITGTLANVAASAAGLFNPSWNFFPTEDLTRNPDGTYTSGGESPGMDGAGVTLDPRLAR